MLGTRCSMSRNDAGVVGSSRFAIRKRVHVFPERGYETTITSSSRTEMSRPALNQILNLRTKRTRAAAMLIARQSIASSRGPNPGGKRAHGQRRQGPDAEPRPHDGDLEGVHEERP